MSARHEPESAKMTLAGWAVCLAACWFTMQIVDLAAQVLR